MRLCSWEHKQSDKRAAIGAFWQNLTTIHVISQCCPQRSALAVGWHWHTTTGKMCSFILLSRFVCCHSRTHLSTQRGETSLWLFWEKILLSQEYIYYILLSRQKIHSMQGIEDFQKWSSKIFQIPSPAVDLHDLLRQTFFSTQCIKPTSFLWKLQSVWQDFYRGDMTMDEYCWLGHIVYSRIRWGKVWHSE